MTLLTVDDIKDQALLLNINVTYKEGMTEDEVLWIAQRAWRIDEKRKNNPNYAIAVYKNEVKGVFEILSWHKDEFEKGRWAFKGKIAEPSIRNKYLKTIESNWQQGRESLRYVNC